MPSFDPVLRVLFGTIKGVDYTTSTFTPMRGPDVLFSFNSLAENLIFAKRKYISLNASKMYDNYDGIYINCYRPT